MLNAVYIVMAKVMLAERKLVCVKYIFGDHLYTLIESKTNIKINSDNKINGQTTYFLEVGYTGYTHKCAESLD